MKFLTQIELVSPVLSNWSTELNSSLRKPTNYIYVFPLLTLFYFHSVESRRILDARKYCIWLYLRQNLKSSCGVVISAVLILCFFPVFFFHNEIGLSVMLLNVMGSGFPSFSQQNVVKYSNITTSWCLAWACTSLVSCKCFLFT